MKKNILLIESDNDSLSLMKEILEEKGYTVFATIYIENAFDILIQGIKIDLIMVSTYIENAECFSMLKRFKEHRISTGLPLFAIAQSAETSEGPRAIKEGCVAYITKPIDEELLDKRLNEIFNMEANEHGQDSSS